MSPARKGPILYLVLIRNTYKPYLGLYRGRLSGHPAIHGNTVDVSSKFVKYENLGIPYYFAQSRPQLHLAPPGYAQLPGCKISEIGCLE